MSSLGKLVRGILDVYFIRDIGDLIMEYIEYVSCDRCRGITHIYILTEHVNSGKFMCTPCLLNEKKIGYDLDLNNKLLKKIE